MIRFGQVLLLVLLIAVAGVISMGMVLGAHQTLAGASHPAVITTTPVPTCGSDSNYTYTQASFGRIGFNADFVPGSACDECVLSVAMPITFTMYGQPFTNVLLGDNGTLAFIANPNPSANTCIPATGFSYAILPYWDDLTMNFTDGGIFTTFDAGLHSFAMEWRARKGSDPVNFEVTLYQTTGRIEIIYGSVSISGNSATVGVQRDNTTFTQVSCDAPNLFPRRLLLTFTQPPCPTLTATPANSMTATPITSVTATRTGTRTPTPMITTTSTPTITTTPKATTVIVGHVTWQGRPPQPDPLQQLPVTLTLKSDTLEQNYPEQITDSGGFFTATTASLPSDTYQYRVKGPKYLAKSGTVLLNGLQVQSPKSKVQSRALRLWTLDFGPSTSVEMGLMRTGDANNDNTVNIGDFSILRATFGKGVGEPTYDDRADFTGDQRVDVRDFSLLRQNFGSTGAPPISPP